MTLNLVGNGHLLICEPAHLLKSSSEALLCVSTLSEAELIATMAFLAVIHRLLNFLPREGHCSTSLLSVNVSEQSCLRGMSSVC